MRRLSAEHRDLNRQFIACPTCDALLTRPPLQPGQRARCPRCHSVIAANKINGTERTTALMVASLLVYAVAISFPFMSMERSGLANQISVIDAVDVLWNNGMYWLAVVTACLILLFPATRALLLLTMHAAVKSSRVSQYRLAQTLRIGEKLEPWAMADIFMIGVIVSLVKIGDLARISVGPAFWAMSALIVFMAMGTTATCRDTAWNALRARA